MDTIKASALVLDYALYPRHAVDDTHVRELGHALVAGATFPPVVADRSSRRIADGFHRVTAVLKYAGADAEIAVEWIAYPAEAALFEDAVRRNAGHGRRLSPYDQARCIAVAETLSIAPDVIASALSVTVERVDEIKLRKMALGPGVALAPFRSPPTDAPAPLPAPVPVPIKQTIAHLAGLPLTPTQIEGNDRAGGMRPLYYVNQVVNLLEHDLIDPGDDKVMERLRHLRGALDVFLRTRVA